MVRRSLVAFGMLGVLSGCITPSEKKGIQADIFNLQTRLLDIEKQGESRGKDLEQKGENTNRKLATTYTDIEKMKKDLRELQGTVDALRVGVITGQMPGVDPSSQGSIAQSITDIGARLDAIEKAQEDVLAAIKKAGLAAKAKSRTAAKSADEIQSAFDKQNYKNVVEDAPKLLKSDVDGKDAILFALAESHFKLGQMREAALKFNDYIELKPRPSKVAAAKLRMGESFKAMGDTDTAKIYFEEVISEFPGSSEASDAKQKLDSAGGGAKSDG